MSGREKASPNVKEFDPAAPIARDHALTPHVLRINAERVKRGFWPKIRKVASRIPFAGDVLAVWFCARDEATPIAAKA